MLEGIWEVLTDILDEPPVDLEVTYVKARVGSEYSNGGYKFKSKELEDSIKAKDKIEDIECSLGLVYHHMDYDRNHIFRVLTLEEL